MLIVVVTCYLLANVLDVIIAAWEYIDAVSLTQRYAEFYAIAADISSLLTVVAGALRLPIYTANDKTIKREVIFVLRSLQHRLTCEPSDMQRSMNRKLAIYHKQAAAYESTSTFLRYQEVRVESRSGCSTPMPPWAVQTSVGTLIVARAYASCESIRRNPSPVSMSMNTESPASLYHYIQFSDTSNQALTTSASDNAGLTDRLLKPSDARPHSFPPIRVRSWESRI